MTGAGRGFDGGRHVGVVAPAERIDVQRQGVEPAGGGPVAAEGAGVGGPRRGGGGAEGEGCLLYTS
uniref:hypothetical protein n=1 Tax=Streptomyces sp. rh155 TaxID=3028728 RepID=UPI003C7CF440